MIIPHERQGPLLLVKNKKVGIYWRDVGRVSSLCELCSPSGMKDTVQSAYSDSPGLCVNWRKAVNPETLKSIFPSTPPGLAQKRQKMLLDL